MGDPRERSGGADSADDAGRGASEEWGDDGSDDSDSSGEANTGMARAEAEEAVTVEDEEATLRRQIEEKYDFENFGPRDMAEMTPEEWEVAFDPDTWITGEELLVRVEDELKSRVATRDVFAVVERAHVDGADVVVAYSDTDYALVYPDGSVEGRGTVVRDVKPTVALCSMDDYEVETPPENWQLPAPEEIPDSGSELGNWMIQLLAGTQLLVGIGALVAWVLVGMRENIVLLAAGLGFVFIGLVLFTMVANARLSQRFRVEEYRSRLRSVGTASEERPAFLPLEDDAFERARTSESDDGL
ncbi:DUF7319 domain-containing protein [Natronobiforma cellulositropha]|uniref:DUF7319 domain-containing protein n=1 Tax=Natronobiforma cellulositropha TaxID=1679076 RepID=UPI0021D576CC|nr:hypothetical protein [Natronobiforma cellulositropha]